MNAILFADEESVRRVIRQEVAKAIPAEHVDEVVDLAFHAAQRAMDSLFTSGMVASRANIAKTAITLAWGLLRESCSQYEAAAAEVAEKEGATIINSVVTVRAR